jgi:uncharacterized protein (DUF736 family)
MATGTASKQIGALWRRAARQGDTGEYLKGNLDLGALGQVSIVVFQNNRKQKDNEPDYRIVLSRPYSGNREEEAEPDTDGGHDDEPDRGDRSNQDLPRKKGGRDGRRGSR